MANVLVVVSYALLSVYRMNSLSALEYLKKIFREVLGNHRDYEELLL